MKRIAIIGGGPTAVFSAFLLEQKSSEPLAVSLFEAKPRLGGKVQTERFTAAPILYEAGVAELYRYGADPLWLLVSQRLGLPVVEMGGDAVVFDGKILRGEADIVQHYGEATAQALRQFRDEARAVRPYSEFYNGGWPADNKHPWSKKSLQKLLARVVDPVARRYIEILIHSDVATEPQITSGLYGLDNYLINERDYCQLYSIEGGIGRLISTLAAELSARVMLSARVVGVDPGDGGVYRVRFEHDGQRLVEEFDAVLVALPTYAMRHVSFGGELGRAVDRHVGRYDEPAHYLRITALFRTPFWRDAVQGSYFIHDAFGGCCVYDEGARYPAGDHGVLSWLLSGNDALSMTALEDQTLVQRAIDSLPAVIAAPGQARAELM